MKSSITKFLGVVASFLSIGSIASAGSMADGMADPMVEDLVIAEEESSSSIGILPIIAIVAIGALLISNDDDDSSSADPDPKD